MAFLLRQISHSADGREIVRPSRVEGDRLTIGRDPGCDVHLTDLAVALTHATVERAGPAVLSVAAGPGLYVELNGRKVTSGSIDVAGGGDIRIASHFLRFLPTPADSSEIGIDIERVAEARADLDASDDRLFSLASVLPSKRVAAWLFALLVLGLCLAWPIKSYYDRQQRQDQQAAARQFHADEMWSAPVERQ